MVQDTHCFSGKAEIIWNLLEVKLKYELAAHVRQIGPSWQVAQYGINEH